MFLQLDSAADMLLEEYLMNDDVQEAAECLKDLKEPNYHYRLVEKYTYTFLIMIKNIYLFSCMHKKILTFCFFRAINLAISRKESERKLLSKLLYDFYAELNLLTSEAVNKGYTATIPLLSYDVFSFWAFLYLAPTIKESE